MGGTFIDQVWVEVGGGTILWTNFNVIFRNLHPYRLSNGQLFCLLVMQQKLDSGVSNPALISDFSTPNW